jgi:transcriptional regulator with XRE-family HTH domain
MKDPARQDGTQFVKELPERFNELGSFIREQRSSARLSLRRLSELAGISNPYLSQIERGLHRPSIAIIKSLAEALNLSTSDLLAHAADIVTDEESATTTEGAIRNDPFLNDTQKSALLAVYRSMVDAAPDRGSSTEGEAATTGPVRTATETPSGSGTRPTRKKADGMP